ncbi:MAG TPA: universal stress protein [Polyangiales bacterium]|jgi:nucleotide-binding universal stress UspA family protein|nr:universal stress protein [Polyangiales bacterium]
MIPRLVVAYDFSDPARRAFELGVFMGRQLDAEVHVVTVLDPGTAGAAGAEQELRDLRQLLEMKTCGTVKAEDVAIECHALSGHPAEAIMSMAREIDAPLIICGTTGKGAVARTLLGSVSHELVHKSGAIVMSVP